MSISGGTTTSSDCFSSDDSDLLCLEEDAGIFTDELPAVYTPDLVSTSVIEESVALFVQEEGNYLPGFDYPSKFHSLDHDSLDASARQSSIAWILKIQEFYNFQPLTVYLSVNYMDRFLSSRHLPQANGWPLQLLSVACLSLAAKMEESKVPDLLDIQVEDPKHFFEPRTIRKMELIVLTTLDWKLRSITPFNFIDFFANKVDPSGTFVSFLVSQATKIILASIKEISFINYPPSSMAAAAIVCATDEIPNLSFISPGSSVEWCDGLTKERVASCYKLMQEVVLDYTPRTPPKVLPQLRVRAPGVWLSSIDSPSSSSSSSSTSTTPLSANKRRKLNTASWIDDDKENKPCIIRGKKKQ